MSAERPAERPPRLSPFVFPSDTAFRFGLLVVAVLGANLYVWQWISTAFRNPADERAATLACLSVAPGASGSLTEFDAASNAFSGCVAQLYRYQVWWMLAGTAALLVVAVALLAGAPWWVRRRRRLQPLSATDAPAAVAEIHALAAEQGLAPPSLYWNPLDPSAGGLAFGRPGAYAIALGGGLVVRQATDPPAFRAVVRHELAHIRNRDVGITYLTLAIWTAFLLASVVPFVLTLLDEGKETLFALIWRLGALAALVYLTRNAVLRSRELYADVRASVHDVPDGALRRVLAALPPARRGLPARLRRVHPDPARRLEIVADTRSLFPLGAVVAFAAGLTATIAYEGVVSLLSTFVADPLDLRFLSALAFAPLAVAVVGVAIWREAFAALAAGREPAQAWPDGLAFAAGVLVGPELALQRPVTGNDTLLGAAGSLSGFLWAATLVAGLLLVLEWTRASARLWLHALGGRRPRAASMVGLLASAAALTVFLGVFYGARGVRESLAFSRAASQLQRDAIDRDVWTVPLQVWQFVFDGELLLIVQKPYFVPVLALLALFPLASALVSRTPVDASWAFLDPGGELHASPAQRPLRPLLVGAAAGTTFLVLAVLLRLGIHFGVSAETRATDAAILSIFVTTVALAVLVQLFAGAAGAWRDGLTGALGAAFVAGCFGWLGIVGGPAVGGCIDPLSINPGPCAWTVESTFSWHVFQQVTAQGAIAGTVGGLAALVVRALLGHRRGAQELHAAGVPG